MKSIDFYKMEGAGNDFVVIDNRDEGLSMDELIRGASEWCNRRFGIGADGLLALCPPEIPGTDYKMVYRNADGSDAGMCGNGARCLALFAAHNGFGNTQHFSVHDAIYSATVAKLKSEVSIMFPDVMEPIWIDVEGNKLVQSYTGTEHVVCFTDQRRLDDEESLVSMGRNIREHDSLNPPGTNVNFVHRIDEETIQLQTYERGVEQLTLACGTGALASAISCHFLEGKTEGTHSYTIQVKGGALTVRFTFDKETGTYKKLTLGGPAHFVFSGKTIR
jgi:diaminopimelate epimerase